MTRTQLRHDNAMPPEDDRRVCGTCRWWRVMVITHYCFRRGIQPTAKEPGESCPKWEEQE